MEPSKYLHSINHQIEFMFKINEIGFHRSRGHISSLYWCTVYLMVCRFWSPRSMFENKHRQILVLPENNGLIVELIKKNIDERSSGLYRSIISICFTWISDKSPAMEKFSRTCENTILYLCAARTFCASSTLGYGVSVIFSFKILYSVYKIPPASSWLSRRSYLKS